MGNFCNALDSLIVEECVLSLYTIYMHIVLSVQVFEPNLCLIKGRVNQFWINFSF